ncbi:hypothetical protein C5D07_09475 [Rathayibacter tritici]|nr:hypothetical protein C5C06_03645 [Rathayibacter tritici]PPI13630.1 hypothetical protein C5D07_09475 [Rathayibacter tritici]
MRVPKFAAPSQDRDWDDDAEAARQAFAVPARLAVLLMLRDAGEPILRTQIMESTGLNADTVHRTLIFLEGLGIVEANLPRTMWPGRSVMWRVNHDRYQAVLDAFMRRIT